MVLKNWSYSSLGLFQQCPHKYYRLRVRKDVIDPPNDATNYGKEVHKAAEDFIKSGTPIPEKFSFLVPVMEKMVSYEGNKYPEYKMGLTRNLEPCGFFDRNVWWRGVADLLIINNDFARCVDYKTSKSSKFADTKQLEILSLAVFKHFPRVKRVKGGLLFVVANALVASEFEADKSDTYWQRWLVGASQLEKAYEVNVWNPRPNFTCKKWCPVKDCTHNGG